MEQRKAEWTRLPMELYTKIVSFLAFEHVLLLVSHVTALEILNQQNEYDCVSSEAARNGSLYVLKWVHQYKPEKWNRYWVADLAAQYGHVHILDYIRTEWPDMLHFSGPCTLVYALTNESYNTLYWLVQYRKFTLREVVEVALLRAWLPDKLYFRSRDEQIQINMYVRRFIHTYSETLWDAIRHLNRMEIQGLKVCTEP
jgi:hypothetical protein